MQITKEDVEHIASLARLDFSEEEKQRYRTHLEQILNYVQKLNELNTDDVEATYYVQYTRKTMRKDNPQPSLKREEVFKNVPKQSHGFFCVPKVIQKT